MIAEFYYYVCFVIFCICIISMIFSSLTKNDMHLLTIDAWISTILLSVPYLNIIMIMIATWSSYTDHKESQEEY